YMHGVYLKNLANPDKQKLHLSKASLVNYLDLNERVGGSGVMFHPGSLKDREEGEALQQVSEVLDWILDHAEGESILMLEVSAGSGKVIGGRFEQLAQIFAGVSAKNQKRLKYCLDTQHMWASGYDIVSDLDVVIEELDNYLGLENVRCVHVNDSVPELGSGKDRHANLGEGTIGEKGIKGFINHKKLKHLPMLMETPALKDFPEGAQKEVDKLLAWAE
ncbi:MAG: deoxyribonuclease IV, partial [Candidatus Dojkabacteria bacterium]